MSPAPPPRRGRNVRDVQTKKGRIQLYTNEIQTIESIFVSKIRKGDSMSPAPPPRRGRKVRDVQTKKKRIQLCTNEIQTIESIFESKIRIGGIACPQPPPPRRERKVRGVQTKKDVYNRVQTKYKRLSPFSNPKSEKVGLATCTCCCALSCTSSSP